MTRLDVFNGALTLVGRDRMAQDTADSAEGNACRVFYDSELRQALLLGPWPWAYREAPFDPAWDSMTATALGTVSDNADYSIASIVCTPGGDIYAMLATDDGDDTSSIIKVDRSSGSVLAGPNPIIGSALSTPEGVLNPSAMAIDSVGAKLVIGVDSQHKCTIFQIEQEDDGRWRARKRHDFTLNALSFAATWDARRGPYYFTSRDDTKLYRYEGGASAAVAVGTLGIDNLRISWGGSQLYGISQKTIYRINAVTAQATPVAYSETAPLAASLVRVQGGFLAAFERDLYRVAMKASDPEVVVAPSDLVRLWVWGPPRPPLGPDYYIRRYTGRSRYGGAVAAEHLLQEGHDTYRMTMALGSWGDPQMIGYVSSDTIRHADPMFERLLQVGIARQIATQFGVGAFQQRRLDMEYRQLRLSAAAAAQANRPNTGPHMPDRWGAEGYSMLGRWDGVG